MASLFLLVIVSVPMLHVLKNQPTVPVARAWLWFIFFFFLGTIPGLVDPSEKETLPIWGLSVFVSVCGPLALVADVVAWKFGLGVLIRLLCFVALLFGISFWI